jgi:hypothetical protein
VTPERLSRDGALLVWRIEGSTTGIPNALARLGPAQIQSPLSFAWPRAPRIRPLRIGWAVLAPSACQAQLA